MKPKVAILMLSWRRFETLIESLVALPRTFEQPVHLILRVQGMENLTDEQRQQVHTAARGFTSTDIYFTRDNVGSAAARMDLIHRGAKAGYEYLMFTDDDISFPPGGIDYQIYILDKYPEIGSISIRPGGINKIQAVHDGEVVLTTYEDIGESICEVYLIGSASIMFRALLYLDHLVAPDSAYYIGTWDWDFVVQIRKTGYKVCVITDREIINKRGGDPIYRSVRRGKRHLRENRRLFISKWGFDPVKSRRFTSNFVRPVTFEDKLRMAEEDLRDFEEELRIEDEKEDRKLASKSAQPIQPSFSEGTDWRSRMINGQINQQQNIK